MRYLTSKSLLTLIAGFLLTFGDCAVMYADNPHTGGGTGQPNQSCEQQPNSPPGFSSGGFANADEHYNPGSQYDVACYQQSNNGPNNSYGSGVNNGGGH